MRTPYKTMGGEPRHGRPLSREEKIDIIWKNAVPHRAMDGNRRQIIMPGSPPQWRYLEALSDEELDGMLPDSPSRAFNQQHSSSQAWNQAPPALPQRGASPSPPLLIEDLDYRIKQLNERVAYLEEFIDRMVGPMTTWNRPEDRE